MSTRGLDTAQDRHEPQGDLSINRSVACACNQCRKKKIRCNGEATCNNCLAHKTQCVYTETSKKRAAPRGAKYIASLEERLEKIGQLLRLKFPNDDLVVLQSYLPDRGESWLLQAVYDNSVSEPRGFDNRDVDTADKETAASAEQRGYLMTAQDEEVDFIGASGPATMIVTSLQKIDQILGDASFSQCCANVQRRVVACHYRNRLHYMNIMLQSWPKPEQPVFPDTATCHRYINLYFSNVHPIYPFLDKREFLQNVQLLLDPTREVDWAFSGIYIMVLAFGSHIAEGSLPGRLQCEGSDLYAHAQKLSVHIAEMTSLHALHAMLLMAHYLEASSRIPLLWTLLGTVIRKAQSLGLHRKLRAVSVTVEQKSFDDAAKIEIRRRTFWTIYTIDSNLVASTGRPAGIQDFDCDQEMPSATPEELLYTNDALFRDGNSFSFFLAQVQLSRISRRAQRDLYSLAASSLNPDEILERTLRLDASLLHWAENLPEEFRPERPSSYIGLGSQRTYRTSRDTMYPEVLLAPVHLRYFTSMTTIHRRNALAGSVPNTRHTLLASPPPASRLDASLAIALHASRCCLTIVSAELPLMHAAGMKLDLLFPVSATLLLFIAILRSPASPTVPDDVNRIRAVVATLRTCDLEVEVQFGILAEFFEQIIRVINIAAAQTNATGLMRGGEASENAPQSEYHSFSTIPKDYNVTSAFEGVPHNDVHNTQGGLRVPIGDLYVSELFGNTANLLGTYPALETSLLGFDVSERYDIDVVNSLDGSPSVSYEVALVKDP